MVSLASNKPNSKANRAPARIRPPSFVEMSPNNSAISAGVQVGPLQPSRRLSTRQRIRGAKSRQMTEWSATHVFFSSLDDGDTLTPGRAPVIDEIRAPAPGARVSRWTLRCLFYEFTSESGLVGNERVKPLRLPRRFLQENCQPLPPVVRVYDLVDRAAWRHRHVTLKARDRDHGDRRDLGRD